MMCDCFFEYAVVVAVSLIMFSMCLMQLFSDDVRFYLFDDVLYYVLLLLFVCVLMLFVDVVFDDALSIILCGDVCLICLGNGC